MFEHGGPIRDIVADMTRRFSDNPDDGPRGPRVAPWLFAAFACFYALGSGGHISTPDGTIMMRVTGSIVDRAVLDIEELTSWRKFGGKHVVDRRTGEKRFYAKYGVGLSIAAAPAYAIGRLLLPLARDAERNLFEIGFERAYRGDPKAARWKLHLSEPGNYRFLWYDGTSRENFDEVFLGFCTSLTNALIAAAIVAGVYLICRQLDYSARTAILVAVLAGVATPLWHYSKTFFSEPLAALGMTYCFYFLIRGARPDASRWYWTLAGAMFGVAVVTKLFHVVLFAAVASLLVGYWPRLPRREAVLRTAGCVGSIIVALVLVGWYNFVRFGNPLEAGYGDEARVWTSPALQGLAGLLISPGRGLVIYCPLVIVSAMGAKRFADRFRLELLFILLCVFWLAAAYSKWHMWHGGWCWGPRFLVPILPLLVIPVAAVIQSPPRRPAEQLVLGLLLGFSFVVALSGVLVNYNDYHNWAYSMANSRGAFGWANYYQLICWHPRHAPVLAYWRFPKDYFLVSHAIRQPGLILAMFGTFLAGTVAATIALLRAWRRLEPTGGDGQ